MAEFESFGVCCTRHATQLVVEAEVVLEGSRGHGLALSLNVHVLLGFDGLMKALGQTASGHGPAGVLVNQNHLAVLYDVLDIAVKQIVSAKRGINVV